HKTILSTLLVFRAAYFYISMLVNAEHNIVGFGILAEVKKNAIFIEFIEGNRWHSIAMLAYIGSCFCPCVHLLSRILQVGIIGLVIAFSYRTAFNNNSSGH